MVQECFTEQARAESRLADIVVTNHALLAIDAFGDPTLLPEHDAVVVDEGHELVDRVTSAITDELTVGDGRAGGPPVRSPGQGASAEGLAEPDQALARRRARTWPWRWPLAEGRMTALPAGLTRRPRPGPRQRAGVC